METKRQRQVAETIKRHFGTILQREGSLVYGAQALVTITNVKMSPDFGIAKIYLSVYNHPSKQEVILEMEAEQQKLRQSLAQRVRNHLRRVPELQFYLDDTLDEMYRLNQMFDRLHTENQMGEEE